MVVCDERREVLAKFLKRAYRRPVTDSEIDGKRYDWQEGDAVHVPPRMTIHEHFNDSDARTRTLRVLTGGGDRGLACGGHERVKLRATLFSARNIFRLG